MFFLDKAWLQEYRLPIAVALTMHLLLLFFMTADFGLSHAENVVKKPKAVQAKLIRLQEKKPKAESVKKKEIRKKSDKQRKLEKKKAEQRKAEKKKNALKKKEQKKQALLKKQQAEKKAKEQAEKLEKAQQQRLEKERIAREAALDEADRIARESAFMNDFAEEEMLLNSASDEAEAMSYIAVIQQAIMSNWSRPASARNGMKVTLQITMFPNGQINNVNITKDGSSGNAAFDRSAITAVEKTERISELAQLKTHVFERYYRSFKIEFRPEDLRL